MADNLTKLTQKLLGAIQDAKTSSPYDTTAKVVRVEDDTLWVHIPGGVDETPIKKTINASAGDAVQVRISNGSAWITGNVTAPPTDDSQANKAYGAAQTANITAIEAETKAQTAANAAESAVNSANAASEAAQEAQGSALSAAQSANNALKGLSTVESVVDVVNWFKDHKTPTTDTTVNPNKTYYSYDAITHSLSIVTPEGTENPYQQNWYELTEAIQEYVTTHVAVDTAGLYIIGVTNDWKVLIASGDDQTNYPAGIYLIDPSGNAVSVFGTSIRLGNENDLHVTVDNDSFNFYNSNDLTGVIKAPNEVRFFGPVADNKIEVVGSNQELTTIYTFTSGESSLSTKTIPYENDLNIYVYYNGVNITSSRFCTLTRNSVILEKASSGIVFAEGDEVAVRSRISYSENELIGTFSVSGMTLSNSFGLSFMGPNIYLRIQTAEDGHYIWAKTTMQGTVHKSDNRPTYDSTNCDTWFYYAYSNDSISIYANDDIRLFDAETSYNNNTPVKGKYVFTISDFYDREVSLTSLGLHPYFKGSMEDYLFVIGDGKSDNDPDNALVIKADGTIAIRNDDRLIKALRNLGWANEVSVDDIYAGNVGYYTLDDDYHRAPGEPSI